MLNQAELKKYQEDQLGKEEIMRREMSQLSLENQLLENNLKMTNETNEEDLERVMKELDVEKERVKQLNIENKMIAAENQWLKDSLKVSYDDYEEELEKMKKELKNVTSWKFWKHTE